MTGVPLPESGSDTTVDLILENPGRGAGEPVSVPGREGTGLVPVLSLNEACGAGTVMKPLSIVLFVGLLASLFLFFVFSVLPLERGCASRNSAACGTALRETCENMERTESESNYPLFPTERTKCACPVFSWRIWNALFMLKGVSPLAIASCFFSSAIFFRRFSVFILPEPLP